MLFGGLLHRLIQWLDLAVQLLEQLQQIFPQHIPLYSWRLLRIIVFNGLQEL
jgi:hypothetical protein